MMAGKKELMALMERSEKISNAFLKLQRELAEINVLHPIGQGDSNELLV